MKTRTLLIIASLHVFGVTAGMPQAQQDEAVGFINLVLLPGYNLVANQLNGAPDNLLTTIFTHLPAETQVLRFNNGVNNYELEIFTGNDWIKADGSPGTLSANPGAGAFVFNPDSEDVVLTLVGSVPEGPNLSISLPSGFSMISFVLPRAVSLSVENGFPQIPGSQVIFWDPITQNYEEPIFNEGTMWIRADGTEIPAPTVAVGQGFFFFNPGPPARWPSGIFGE